MEIKFIETSSKKEKPEHGSLGFGKYFTDYMFVMDYQEGKGWVNPTIMPYGPIRLDPSTMVFHYGQSVFEGLKAYLTDKGDVHLFRPEQNISRLNISNERLCIPLLDEDFVLEALKKLIKIEKDWIPAEPGTSLYIRPFVFGIDPVIGVRASKNYKFMIILSPVSAYYAEGLNPVKIYVEKEYVRAVRGGIGASKASGNYAASIKAQEEAKKKGFSQVLWLDGVEQRYIEEVGTMNVFFRIKDEIITPKLNGSILDGVTRRSVIELLNDFGYKVTQRRISIDELEEAYEKGELTEVFGTGTAAVISPVGEILMGDKRFTFTNGEVQELSQKLYDTLTGIQSGKLKDTKNWVVKL
jgi:branched-chain amino acid aminotransferase